MSPTRWTPAWINSPSLAVTPPESAAPNGDEAAIAADLVDEAVATYQEHSRRRAPIRGGRRPRWTDGAPRCSPRWPRPWSRAIGSHWRQMEPVLEEHYQTGQSIARILTAQKLVTEADLMWGMAQEMGLEFVDLDTVGVDMARRGPSPRRRPGTTTYGDRPRQRTCPWWPPPIPRTCSPWTTSAPSWVAASSSWSPPVPRSVPTSGGPSTAVETPADMAMEASLGIEGSTATAKVWTISRPSPRGSDRPVRQPADPAGAQRAGLRRPHRAHGHRTADSLPHRRSPP